MSVCVSEYQTWQLGIETFMRYVFARYEMKQRELAYRIYVTDALRLLGGFEERYYDWVQPQRPDPDITSTEIIGNLKRKLGGG